jgi:hypothetical protein
MKIIADWREMREELARESKNCNNIIKNHSIFNKKTGGNSSRSIIYVAMLF